MVLWDGDPNTLYFRVNDRAGNIAEPVSVEIPTNEGSLPTKAKTSSTLDLWNILFIIIILIIILALAVFILKRKKTEKQEKRQEPTTQDAITVKPSEPFSSIPIKPGGELTVDNQTEQLPVRTIITSGAAETEMPVPELPATTTAGTVPGQTPEPQQMPESPEKPQLPPAQTQDQPLQPQPNETSTGIVSQPSPATPEQPQPQAVQKKLDENEST